MGLVMALVIGALVFFCVLGLVTSGFKDSGSVSEPTTDLGQQRVSGDPGGDHEAWSKNICGPGIRRLSGTRWNWLRKLLVQSGNSDPASIIVFGAVRNLIRSFFPGLLAATGVYLRFRIVPTVLIVVLGFFIGGWIPVELVRMKIARRRRAIEAQLPEVLEVLALQAESGLGLVPSCRKVTELLRGPLPEEFLRVTRQVELGLPIKEALSNMGNLIEHPQVFKLVDALMQSGSNGASLAKILRLQAENLRGAKGTQ